MTAVLVLASGEQVRVPRQADKYRTLRQLVVAYERRTGPRVVIANAKAAGR